MGYRRKSRTSHMGNNSNGRCTPVEITIDGEDEEIAFDKLSVAAQEI